jgi:hypothetical protein
MAHGCEAKRQLFSPRCMATCNRGAYVRKRHRSRRRHGKRSVSEDELVVTVAMVQVGKMPVTVRQRIMLVPVSMRRRSFLARMLVLMMLVMAMHVLVIQRFVRVEMGVALR